MDKKELQEKLDNLKTQQKQVEANWTKVQGAIEFCESLMEDKEEVKEDKK